MTLPFVIDPLAWPFAALAAGALVWAYTRPSHHFIKELWWTMVISKAEACRPLLGRHYKPNFAKTAITGRIFFWGLLTALSGTAAMSLAVCVGLVQSPAPPPPTLPPFDPTKFEIVFEGHVIYARPVAEPVVKPSFFSETWPYGSPSSFRERQDLIAKGVLFDGMPPDLAHSVLGPPTSTEDGHAQWYHNPEHRWHVAAGFRARIGDDGKYHEWTTDNW